MSLHNTKPSYTQRNRPEGRSGRSYYNPDNVKFAIYPDYWKDSWGERPLLGHVWATEEFYAEREAYNRGLLTVNFTFGPKAVKVYTPKRKQNRS